MIDINAEAEKALEQLECNHCYYYPDKFNDLPIVCYYNLTECPGFSSDNEEASQNGTVQIDIYADNPLQCGKIGLQVNGVMAADGWAREFSRDLTPENQIYHRTMRFTKIFEL